MQSFSSDRYKMWPSKHVQSTPPCVPDVYCLSPVKKPLPLDPKILEEHAEIIKVIDSINEKRDKVDEDIEKFTNQLSEYNDANHAKRLTQQLKTMNDKKNMLDKEYNDFLKASDLVLSLVAIQKSREETYAKIEIERAELDKLTYPL